MSEYVKFDLEGDHQIAAFLSLLDEHSAEDCLHIGMTARGEAFLGAKGDTGKLKCMHFIDKEGCVKTAWSDDGEEDPEEESKPDIPTPNWLEPHVDPLGHEKKIREGREAEGR